MLYLADVREICHHVSGLTWRYFIRKRGWERGKGREGWRLASETGMAGERKERQRVRETGREADGEVVGGACLLKWGVAHAHRDQVVRALSRLEKCLSTGKHTHISFQVIKDRPVQGPEC